MQIIRETASYHDICPTEYVGSRRLAAGREVAALLCQRRTGETIASLSQAFGLVHPDSASNLVRRAKLRIDKSREYRQAIDDIEFNLGMKTENLT